MKKIFILLMFMSMNSYASIKYTCEVQNECKFKDSDKIGECVTKVFRLTLLGGGSLGKMDVLTSDGKPPYILRKLGHDEDELHFLSVGNIAEVEIQANHMGSGRYDGPMDFRGYLFNISCEALY